MKRRRRSKSTRQPAARKGKWRLSRFRALLRPKMALPLLAVLIAVVLAGMGRVWWCDEGDLRLWSWDVWSTHNSQHLIDPYTLSHLQHGIGLYALLTVLFGARMSVSLRTIVVAVVEAAWEIVENTDWMIERYRETTISLDYYGDSIANSLGDYVACLVGIAMARRMPLWVAGLIFVGLELASVWWIRDSLLLNVLMLVWPIDAIRQWQMSG